MRFDLTDLTLFVHVVEAGSITHGAEHMHLAIAAASTRIRNMEAALGAPLLHRERQGVHPTEAGRTLLHSDEIVAAVADGTADIGIVASTVEVAGLEVLPFRVDRFVLVIAASHLLAAAEKIAFADTLDFDFVGLDRASALQRFLSDKAERIGRRLRLRVQLRSFDAVCRLVECNVGIGIVPATTAERQSKTMSIHKLELSDEWAVRKLTICVRRQADLPVYARELVRHLAAPVQAD